MKKPIYDCGRYGSGLGAALLALCALSHAEDTKVTLRPLHAGASMYFGQMYNISDSMAEFNNFTPTVTLPSTNLWIIQDADAGERLHFKLGIAGSFFYPFPQERTGGGYSIYRAGGLAIAQAYGAYDFGDPEKPWLELSVGQQKYKYNPYAKNFGEYLFRSEAYPTSVRTGDWGAIDNANADVWGAAAKAKFLDGFITNDLLFTMADQRYPLYDLSISDVASVNFGKVLQIGGGVTFSRILPVDPNKTKPASPNTGWFTWSASDQQRLRDYIAKQVAADPAFLQNSKVFTRNMKTGAGGDTTVVDTSLNIGGNYWAASQRPLVKFLANGPDDGDTAAAQTGVSKAGAIDYVDESTTFLMGRFAFDPKPLFGWDFLGPQDLVLYGETAVLGLKNYPVYYKSLSQRMPMMAGFNLPTFRYLDFITLEVEYMHDPYLNSNYQMAILATPQPISSNHGAPAVPKIADPVYDPGALTDNADYKGDDFKWTLTAQKSFGVWSLAFQCGKDHFRPLMGNFTPTYTEVMTTSNAKYYMLRLMVNI